MVRSFILRFPAVRALTSRVSQPLLPLTTRIASHSVPARPFSHFPARLTSPPPSPRPSSDSGSSSHSQSGPTLPPNASLSQRLKHLIKSYGWYALGVYFLISALDFSVAFAAINVVGADHVARAAADVKDFFVGFLPARPPEPGRQEMDPAPATNAGGHEGLMAMILLAYTVHKTVFLPVRIGLTAAVTPKLVHWLRARGWAGSAGARRAANEMREKIKERRDSNSRS